MNQNQIYLFYIFLLTGILIGMLFDIFRIMRKSFKTSDFATIMQDILFWLFASVLLMYTVFKFNNGEIRSYVIFGIAIGLIAYLVLFSKIVIEVSVVIIEFIKKIIKSVVNIVLYPIKLFFRLLRKLFFKPVSFVFINIKKLSETSIKKQENSKKKKSWEGF